MLMGLVPPVALSAMARGGDQGDLALEQLQDPVLDLFQVPGVGDGPGFAADTAGFEHGGEPFEPGAACPG